MAKDQSRWIADTLPVAPEEQSQIGPRHTGRPPKIGHRFPCGKLRPHNTSLTPAHPSVIARIRANAVAFGEDVRLTTELMRLNLLGELTHAQTAAGLRLAEIYGRFERLVGLRRSAKSAAYDAGHGDPDLDEARLSPRELARLVEQQTAVRQTFADLQAGLKEKLPPRTRALVEQICVEDQMASSAALSELRSGLDQVVEHFGSKWRKRKLGPQPQSRPRTQEKRTSAPIKPVEPPTRTALKLALRKLRPDLEPHEISEAAGLIEELTVAHADRAKFRREKEHRASAKNTA